MLVAFELASNRPQNLVGFFDNLQSTAADPSCFQVLIKIDDENLAVQELVAKEKIRRPFSIKVLSSPRGSGYFELWKSINQLHQLCDPNTYFVCNLTDEIRFKTSGWDRALRRYIGLFPDHIFRLCTSVYKFRNYSDFWECGYAPENVPFATKRWIDIQGDWCACHGPDAFQQYVSFYLTRAGYPAKEQYKRDVPIWDFDLAGEGIYKGMTEEEMWMRVQRGWRGWFQLVSYPMQLEASRRSRKLLAHIWAAGQELTEYSVRDDRLWKRIRVIDDNTGGVVHSFSYRVNWLHITCSNLWRRPRKYYHCGGRPPPQRYRRWAFGLRRASARAYSQTENTG